MRLLIKNYSDNVKQCIFVKEKGEFDFQEKPFVAVTGTMDQSDSTKNSFHITPNQYLTLPKSVAPFPTSLTILAASKRWGDKKPHPGKGLTVTADGHLLEVKRGVEKTVSSFDIEMANIVFLTQVDHKIRNREQESKSHFWSGIMYH